MNDTIDGWERTQDDPRLDALLRRNLAPRGDDGQGRSHESLLSEVRRELGQDDVRDPHGNSWLRTAAALLPPVMVGGLKSPVGIKLGWKILPLALALPLAMLVGVVAIAWFGLRSIGRPDASRVQHARSQLSAHWQWSARLRWAWLVFVTVIPSVVLWWPTQAFGLLSIALVVYLVVVVTDLSRSGRADRRSVGTVCAVALVLGAFQVTSLHNEGAEPGTAPWRALAPLVLVLAGLSCGVLAMGLRPFGRTRIQIPGLGDLGAPERAIALVGLLLGLLPLAAGVAFALFAPAWSQLRHGPVEERLGWLFDHRGAELQDHLVRTLADPVATVGLDCPLPGLDERIAEEAEQRFPDEALLRAAALAGRLPAGLLEDFRDPDFEAEMLSLPADQGIPGFRLASEELLAWLCSPRLEVAERDRLAGRLARSISEEAVFGALKDARFLVWALDSLDRADLVASSATRLRNLLGGHWLPARESGSAPRFSVGPSREGDWLPSEESGYHAALLIERVGVPEDVDVAAWRSRLATELAEADTRSTGYVEPDDFFELASRMILDRSLGPRSEEGVAGALLRPRDLVVALVIALFAVLVTWRAPVARVQGEENHRTD